MPIKLSSFFKDYLRIARLLRNTKKKLDYISSNRALSRAQKRRLMSLALDSFKRHYVPLMKRVLLNQSKFVACFATNLSAAAPAVQDTVRLSHRELWNMGSTGKHLIYYNHILALAREQVGDAALGSHIEVGAGQVRSVVFDSEATRRVVANLLIQHPFSDFSALDLSRAEDLQWIEGVNILNNVQELLPISTLNNQDLDFMYDIHEILLLQVTKVWGLEPSIIGDTLSNFKDFNVADMVVAPGCINIYETTHPCLEGRRFMIDPDQWEQRIAHVNGEHLVDSLPDNELESIADMFFVWFGEDCDSLHGTYPETLVLFNYLVSLLPAVTGDISGFFAISEFLASAPADLINADMVRLIFRFGIPTYDALTGPGGGIRQKILFFKERIGRDIVDGERAESLNREINNIIPNSLGVDRKLGLIDIDTIRQLAVTFRDEGV